jgi:hypothetical protein
MANVLSLAMKVSADASSVPKQLTPVERALAGLSKEAEKATSVMDKFAASSSAAAAAQARSAADFEKLAAALESRSIKPEEYARQFAALTAAANDTAAAFAEGARITEQARTADERRTAELERLAQLLELGAINEETFSRASAEASGANAEAARAERERADAAAAAARIIQANLTPQERYDNQIQELTGHLNAGRLSQEIFDRAVASATASLTKAESAAEGYDRAVEAAGDGGTLKFNELSGVLAALPGPIGNVAGRLSGLSSAGEGLARIFSGGLRQGIASIGTSLAGLINPITATIGAIGGLATAAVSIGRGLVQLDDRVESLGNTADKLGISFEFVQTLDEAARRSGTSIDAVSAAFGRLQKSVTGVDDESKAAQKALDEIGLTAAELQALRPEQQYQLLARRIREIENPARRTATALNLFGRAGADLLPFFANIDGAATDLERVGAALSTAQRRDIDEFGAAIDRLSVSAKGAGEQLRSSFAGAGAAIANALASATGSVAQFLEEQNKFRDYSEELQKLRREWQFISAGPVTDAAIQALKAGQTAEQVLRVARGEAVELKDAIEEPPSDAFVKSLSDITKKIEEAKLQSVEFGQAGFDAAVEYEQAIATLKEQFDAGLFNEETFRQQAANVAETFKREIAGISEDAKLEIQLESDAQRTLAGLNAEVDKAIQSAQDFGQEGFDAALGFQNKIDELRRQFDAGIINDETLRRGVESANAAYDQQIEKLRQIQTEQQRIIDADRARVEGLLAAQGETAKIEEDILAVQREAARVSQEAAAARDANNALAAEGAAARLAQLDQLQAQLDEQLQAAEQGFGQAGFGPAFEQINAQLAVLADKAAEFGNAGAQAFAQLQQGVAEAQQQARDGILNREALEQQVAAQQRLFEQELANIDAANERRKEAAADQAEQRKQLEQDALRQQEEQSKAQQQAQQQLQEAYFQEQQRIAEERRKAEEAEFARQQERLRQLNTLGEGVVNTADVRTQEGAAIVLGLAANAQDPRLIEARLTNKLMRQQLNALVGNLTRIGLEVSLP